jgi:hypothetical protein
MPDEGPRIKVDSDWKAEAAREKEKLQQSQTETADESLGQAAPLPEASFANLVAGLRVQGLIALGAVPDPASRQPQPDREQAKYVIDTLGVLEAKTAGNLTKDEKDLLDAVLYELRLAFLRM